MRRVLTAARMRAASATGSTLMAGMDTMARV